MALHILTLLLTLTLLPLVHSLSQEYCSKQNTGSGTDGAYWQYQSNGWCHDNCVDSYAFAIVQGSYCWCSNYVPSSTVDVSECNVGCPGYGEESCGNADDGLFGYIALNKKASGTTSGGLASSTKSPSAQSSSSLSRSSSSAPAASSTSSAVAESSVQTTSKSVSSSSKSTRSSDSSSVVTTPITSIQVITESGAAITKTVTIMPTTLGGQSEESSKGGMSGGAIAGAVVGSLAGLAGIIGILVWFLAYRRRRNQKGADYENGTGGQGKTSPQRNESTMSRAGLLRSEKRYPPVAIPGPTRNSSNGTDGISPVSGSNSERRHSRPLFYDQRLNPSALMDLDNGSHTSIATIEDNKDYTRTLNVRNPDPPEE